MLKINIIDCNIKNLTNVFFIPAIFNEIFTIGNIFIFEDLVI